MLRNKRKNIIRKSTCFSEQTNNCVVTISDHSGRSPDMTTTGEARYIFQDARALYLSSLERLQAGDIRDAAEKAWRAQRSGQLMP